MLKGHFDSRKPERFVGGYLARLGILIEVRRFFFFFPFYFLMWFEGVSRGGQAVVVGSPTPYSFEESGERGGGERASLSIACKGKNKKIQCQSPIRERRNSSADGRTHKHILPSMGTLSLEPPPLPPLAPAVSEFAL